MADGKIIILDETDKTSIENTITTHTSNKSNPHGVSLSNLGVTATATELNYVDGVTSAIQTQLNNKVATTRKVNGKALSSDITLSASDVSARPSTWTPTASDVGAVPTSRTVNNKALSSNITLSASDVSAVPTTRKVNNKALSADITLSASDVGAAASGHGHTTYALLDGSNELDGEQKFIHSEYCPTLNDTANGIGCAIKATRGLFNEMLADKLVITGTTQQMPIYAYSGTNGGSMANMNRVAYVDTAGNAVFNGSVSASNIADTVIESGVAGSLSYQKWSSGKSEAWYFGYIGDLALTTSDAGGVWTNMQYKDRSVDIAPGIFTATPLAFGNVCSNGYTHCQVCNTYTNKFVYRIWAPYSCTVTSCHVSVYLVGTWK